MLKTFKIIGKIILFAVCLIISWIHGYSEGTIKGYECLRPENKNRLDCIFNSGNIEIIELDKLEEINLQNKEQTLK